METSNAYKYQISYKEIYVDRYFLIPPPLSFLWKNIFHIAIATHNTSVLYWLEIAHAWRLSKKQTIIGFTTDL